jgi:uncharacterized protein (TIGR02271 family)
MATTKRSAAVGVFEDRVQAELAAEKLREAGFRNNQLEVLISEHTRAKDKSVKTRDFEVVAAPGDIAGQNVVLMAEAEGSPKKTTVRTLNKRGTVKSALTDLGIGEAQARALEQEVHAGRALLSVKNQRRFDEAVALLRQLGARDVVFATAAEEAKAPARGTPPAPAPEAARSKTTPQPAPGTGSDKEGTMELREEELHARKQPVKKGEVKVRKEVVTEHKTLDVPVEREEVVVERKPVRGRKAAGSDIEGGKEIRIPVKEEEVRVEKTPVVREEVKVSKRQVPETKRSAARSARRKPASRKRARWTSAPRGRSRPARPAGANLRCGGGGRPPPPPFVRGAGGAADAAPLPGFARPKLQLCGHDPGQKLDDLPFPLRGGEAAVRQLVDLRPQGPQAGPQLVARGAGLKVIGVHERGPWELRHFQQSQVVIIAHRRLGSSLPGSRR